MLRDRNVIRMLAVAAECICVIEVDGQGELVAAFVDQPTHHQAADLGDLARQASRSASRRSASGLASSASVNRTM